MRTELKRRHGQVLAVRAVFAKFGYYKAGRRSILLVYVIDEQGSEVADHAWFIYTRPWYRLEAKRPLRPGDIISFKARVRRYKKFTNTDTYVFDYGLSRVKGLRYE